jgi:hypothetical protein
VPVVKVARPIALQGLPSMMQVQASGFSADFREAQ